MPFGLWTRVDRRNRVLDRGPDPSVRTFCPTDSSPHGRFAPCMDISPPWAIRPINVSPRLHRAKRLWANHPWGEMSSVGRNVHGANRPWAKRLYMGRTVRGAKSLESQIPTKRGNFEEAEGRPIVKYREYRPCAAAMRPFVKLLWPFGIITYSHWTQNSAVKWNPK